MTPGDDGLVALGRPTATTSERPSTTPSSSTAPSRPCPTRARLAAGRRARPEPNRRHRGTSPWTDDGVARAARRRRSPRRGDLRAARRAPSPPRARSTPPSARLDHLVALGVDVVELMPVAAFPGRPGLGLRRRRPVRRARRATAGPAAFAAVRRRLPRPRARASCLDVVHNHLGPSGNYLAAVRPVLHRRAPHAVGRGGQPRRRRAPARCAASSSTTRCAGSATSTSTPCGSTPCTRSRTTRAQHYLAELSAEVAALAARARPPARPRRRVRPQRPDAWSRPTADGGWGMTAQWDDDFHHAAARRAHRRDAGLLRRLRRRTRTARGGTAGGPREGAHPRASSTTATFSSFRGSDVGRPVDRERLDARRLLGYLQTHDQVGNRATGERISAARARPCRSRPPGPRSTCSPPRRRCSSWARSGRRPPRGSSSRASPRTGSPTPSATGRRAEFGSHGWAARGGARPAGPRHPRPLGARLGRGRRPDHARMLRWYTDLTALRGRSSRAGPTRFADVEVDVDDDARWVVLRHTPTDGAPYAVVATLADGRPRSSVAARAAAPRVGPRGRPRSARTWCTSLRSVSVHPLTRPDPR